MDSVLSYIRRLFRNRKTSSKPNGAGTKLFAEPWLLTLAVDVPELKFSQMSLPTLERQLGHYHQLVLAAVKYFPDGQYFINRDGTMCMVGEKCSPQLLVGRLQVVAPIRLDDLMYARSIEARLKADKPSTPLQRLTNCVPLNIHARSRMMETDGTETNCTVRFATRNGKIIVESF